MTPQSKVRSILSVDAFAKIEVRLTPGKISMISLDRPSPLSGESILQGEAIANEHSIKDCDRLHHHYVCQPEKSELVRVAHL
jgi:hypothetical protein